MEEATLSPPGGDSPEGIAKLSLTLAKEGRRRAELDAQMLSNRIALLKAEEEKAWKKIQETRKKKTDLDNLRDRADDRQRAKDEFYRNKYTQLRQQQQLVAAERERARAMRDNSKNVISERKAADARSVKTESFDIEQNKRERELFERATKAERAHMIKSQKDEVKRRLEEEQQMKVEAARLEYEAKVAKEETQRARTEAMVAKLEREEAELILRLQNTQVTQRQAYEELEGSLHNSCSSSVVGGTNKPSRSGSARSFQAALGMMNHHLPSRTGSASGGTANTLQAKRSKGTTKTAERKAR